MILPSGYEFIYVDWSKEMPVYVRKNDERAYGKASEGDFRHVHPLVKDKGREGVQLL